MKQQTIGKTGVRTARSATMFDMDEITPPPGFDTDSDGAAHSQMPTADEAPLRSVEADDEERTELTRQLASANKTINQLREEVEKTEQQHVNATAALVDERDHLKGRLAVVMADKATLENALAVVNEEIQRLYV